MSKVSLNLTGTVATGASTGLPSDLRYISPDASGIAYNGKTVLTLDQAIDNLNRTGAIWNVNGSSTITYTFLEKSPGGLYNNPHETYLAGLVQDFSPFSAQQRDAARDSIQLWDDLIAPSFKEINGKGADIVMMNTGDGGPAQAAAFVPEYKGKYGKIDGDVYVNAGQPDNYDLYYGGYGQTAITHELGHAIGLSHTGDYNFAVGGTITYEHDAEFFQDTYQYSIMSYFSSAYSGAAGYVNWATGGYYQTPQTPMIHDIAAVQDMYGADLTTRTGDTVYGYNSTADRAVYDFAQNKDPFLSIYDAGGNDTLNLSGFTGDHAILDLRPGAFSTGYNHGDAAQLNAMFGLNQSQAFWDAVYDGRTSNPAFLTENIGIAYNTIIENGVTGAGTDILQGNDVGNRLDGGAGNDTFTGGLGNDIFAISQTGFTDRITDFASGQDKVDLTKIDAVANASGDQAFTFIGDGAFTGHAGELHTYATSGVNYLSGDVNGDGVADFIVNLGTVHLNQTDILL